MPRNNTPEAPPTTVQSLGALLKSRRDIMRKDKGRTETRNSECGTRNRTDVIQFDIDRLPGPRSAAVPGCEFGHRPGAWPPNWRQDAALTRQRGRLR